MGRSVASWQWHLGRPNQYGTDDDHTDQHCLADCLFDTEEPGNGAGLRTIKGNRTAMMMKALVGDTRIHRRVRNSC